MNTLSTDNKKNDQSSDYIKLAHLLYLLQALAIFFGGITFFIVLVLAYLNRQHAKDSWLESHYNWQINTVWIGLALVIIGTLTLPFFIGFGILIVTAIWLIYRIVYGWMSLKHLSPVYKLTPII